MKKRRGNRFRKMLAVLLSAVLAAVMIPMPVFAEEDQGEVTVAALTAALSDGTDLYSFKAGDKAIIPEYTVVTGHPAYVSNSRIRKKNGSDWEDYHEEEYTEGLYRYEIWLQIDGERIEQHISPRYVDVNNAFWYVNNIGYSMDGNEVSRSYMVVYSPEYSVAAGSEVSGTGWTLKNGILTITSDEGMADWTANGREDYKTQVTGAVIQDGVTAIGDGAFASCGSLEKVTVQTETPPTIGSGVFENCVQMKEGSILVPAGKEEDYKAAWESYADFIADRDVPAEEHSHSDITFTAWTETDRLPDAAGNYYLTEDVTLSWRWEVPEGTVNLCLGGKTIDGAETEDAVHISHQSTLNLYDHSGGGKITGGRQNGVSNEGAFNLYDGKISGNGSGVFNGGTFHMHGGEITGNGGTNGGGVNNGGAFCMYGGVISGNTAERGGGVYVSDGGEITVGGNAVINGNKDLAGNANNVYLQTEQVIAVDKDNPPSAANIGITASDVPAETKPVNITGANEENYSKYFHSDNGDYTVADSGANHVLQLVARTGGDGSGDNSGSTGGDESGDNSGSTGDGENVDASPDSDSGDDSAKPPSARDGEPKTGGGGPVRIYATAAMIAGFAYLLLYFKEYEIGMSEETKKKLTARMIRWARQGGRIRRIIALAGILLLLVYYHSIGKKTSVEWQEIYEK